MTSVSHSGGTDTYEYDQNGNMTCRQESGVWFVQTYNAENRIASIRELAEGDCETPVRIATQWDYAYDGDGARTATLATPYDENGNPQTASLTTYYFGGAYEVTDGAVKKYYAFGGGTVAMRDGNGLQYFLTDHLGSVLAVTDASGTLISEQRYLPFGEVRTDVGEITQTDFGYTFQRGLPGTGLMDYRARFYAAALGRFTQPDSIVPGAGNPQSLNRYSYVSNSPINRIDPSGHSDSDYRDRMNRLRKAYGDKLWFQYRRAYHRGGYLKLPVFGSASSAAEAMGGDSGSEYKKLNWLLKWVGYGHQDCEQTYKECFYAYSLLSLQDGQQIDTDQFNDLLKAVYYDLNQHHPSQYNPLDWEVRKHYDTPFWNGIYMVKDPNDPDKIEIRSRHDTVVCFGTVCDKRSDINYFAQGMWDAAMGRTLDQSLSVSEFYKKYKYKDTLSDRTKYWIQFGYETYEDLNSQGFP